MMKHHPAVAVSWVFSLIAFALLYVLALGYAALLVLRVQGVE